MTMVVCSCCGTMPEHGSVSLLSHSDIAICYQCLDWLNTQRRRTTATASTRASTWTRTGTSSGSARRYGIRKADRASPRTSPHALRGHPSPAGWPAARA